MKTTSDLPCRGPTCLPPRPTSSASMDSWNTTGRVYAEKLRIFVMSSRLDTGRDRKQFSTTAVLPEPRSPTTSSGRSAPLAISKRCRVLCAAIVGTNTLARFVLAVMVGIGSPEGVQGAQSRVSRSR
eukprot:scaffold6275_cov259-Pinguiococcus_pyrenoidosus.AAC.2